MTAESNLSSAARFFGGFNSYEGKKSSPADCHARCAAARIRGGLGGRRPVRHSPDGTHDVGHVPRAFWNVSRRKLKLIGRSVTTPDRSRAARLGPLVCNHRRAGGRLGRRAADHNQNDRHPIAAGSQAEAIRRAPKFGPSVSLFDKPRHNPFEGDRFCSCVRSIDAPSPAA